MIEYNVLDAEHQRGARRLVRRYFEYCKAVQSYLWKASDGNEAALAAIARGVARYFQSRQGRQEQENEAT